MIRRGSSPCMLYTAKNIFCAVGSNMSDRNFLWNRIYTRSILKSDKKLATGGSSKRSQNNDCTSSSLQKKYQGRVAACPTHLCDSINSRYSFFIFTPETVLHVTRKQNMRRVYQTTSTYRTGAIRHISSTALSSIKEHMRVSLHARD